jgi:hypothetical protein
MPHWKLSGSNHDVRFQGFCIITFKLNETYLGMKREWKVMEIGIS